MPTPSKHTCHTTYIPPQQPTNTLSKNVIYPPIHPTYSPQCVPPTPPPTPCHTAQHSAAAAVHPGGHSHSNTVRTTTMMMMTLPMHSKMMTLHHAHHGPAWEAYGQQRDTCPIIITIITIIPWHRSTVTIPDGPRVQAHLGIMGGGGEVGREPLKWEGGGGPVQAARGPLTGDTMRCAIGGRFWLLFCCVVCVVVYCECVGSR